MNAHGTVTVALETATRPGSLAVLRGGEVLATRVGESGKTQGERLPGEITEALAALGLAFRDVGRYAVTVGPGSFTGLRVGIATIQGLALAGDTPVVCVSTLAALAAAGSDAFDTDVIGAWLDGQRHEVFASAYARDGGESPAACGPGATITEPDGMRTVIPPAVGLPPEVAAAWSAALDGRSLAVLGDGAVRYASALRSAFGARLREIAAPAPLAPFVGQLAARAPASSLIRPHAIQPLYVRRPDAELARARREAARGNQ